MTTHRANGLKRGQYLSKGVEGPCFRSGDECDNTGSGKLDYPHDGGRTRAGRGQPTSAERCWNHFRIIPPGRNGAHAAVFIRAGRSVRTISVDDDGNLLCHWRVEKLLVAQPLVAICHRNVGQAELQRRWRLEWVRCSTLEAILRLPPL